MKILSTIILFSAVAAAGCSSPRSAAVEQVAPSPAPQAAVGTEPSAASAVAMTVVYKTNGNWNEYVPVTLNPERTAVVSYPAPSDLVGATPVKLRDGFLLDRRGISTNTAFTRWTYAEYAALPEPPSTKEILANIIPEAKVTAIYRTNIPVGTPDAVTLCNEAISSGFKGCTEVYSAPTLTLD